MPSIIAHFASESVVVQSYTAYCVERMLTVKETVGVAPGQKPPLRFGRTEVQPLLNSLFQVTPDGMSRERRGMGA